MPAGVALLFSPMLCGANQLIPRVVPRETRGYEVGCRPAMLVDNAVQNSSGSNRTKVDGVWWLAL